MLSLLVIYAFVLGAIIGSFLNVVILRLPSEEKLGGRSHCVFCWHGLKAWDLFPLFSYLFLRGKCRYCQKRISPRYFVIELVTAILFSLSVLVLQPTSFFGYLILVRALVAVSALVVVFMIDWEHFLIFDNVVFASSGVVLAINFLLDLVSKTPLFGLKSFFVSGIIGALAGALPFFLIWWFSKGQWMGFGDVKLALFIGVVLGFPGIFTGLFISVILGGLVSAFLLIFTKNTLKSRLPFGTFLSVGTLVALFFGPQLLRWYLDILGL